VRARRTSAIGDVRDTRVAGVELERSISHVVLVNADGAIAAVADDDFIVAEQIYRRPWRQVWRDHAKRAIDVGGAALLLIVTLPFVAVLALAIKIDSPGPVLFAHRRLGRGGRHFDCLKFRSMCSDAERLLHADERLRHDYVSNHFKIPTDCDPRITRLGRFLRKSSLDELPQLWNILRGEMSLVGPRPIVPLESTHYGERLPMLLAVRPGLTGPWAVQGRSRVGYPRRADIELEYARSWTFSQDLRILARTPWAVFTQRGAL